MPVDRLSGTGWAGRVLPWSAGPRSLERPEIRQAIGDLLGEAPRCHYGPDGTPLVEGAQLSISHDQDLACVVLSRQHSIGVDVCGPVPSDQAARLIRRWWPAQLADWQQLDEAEQQVAFQRLWASTEAVAKATRTPLLPGIARVQVDRSRGWVRGRTDLECRIELPAVAAPFVVAVALCGSTSSTSSTSSTRSTSSTSRATDR